MATGKKSDLKVIPENKVQTKQVVTTAIFDIMLFNAVDFGEQTFGVNVANAFLLEVRKKLNTLSTQYYFYPENNYILTKSKIYRNIILGKFIILYRIKLKTVQVLAIYHSAIKPTKI